MKSIFEFLKENFIEAVHLLRDKCPADHTFRFAIWDDECGSYRRFGYESVYYSIEDAIEGCADDCPWVRMADDDGNIYPLMVTAIRLNEKNCQQLYICTTKSPSEKSDEWIPLTYCDDISYWSVFQYLGDMLAD